MKQLLNRSLFLNTYCWKLFMEELSHRLSGHKLCLRIIINGIWVHLSIVHQVLYHHCLLFAVNVNFYSLLFSMSCLFSIPWIVNSFYCSYSVVMNWIHKNYIVPHWLHLTEVSIHFSYRVFSQHCIKIYCLDFELSNLW